MSIKVQNIKSLEGNWYRIYGLPSQLNVVDGCRMQVAWANDVHVELVDTNGRRICLRTYIALDVITEIEIFKL